jgi:hypothetical protein
MVFMPEHFRRDQPYGRIVVDDYDDGHFCLLIHHAPEITLFREDG